MEGGKIDGPPRVGRNRSPTGNPADLGSGTRERPLRGGRAPAGERTANSADPQGRTPQKFRPRADPAPAFARFARKRRPGRPGLQKNAGPKLNAARAKTIAELKRLRLRRIQDHDAFPRIVDTLEQSIRGRKQIPRDNTLLFRFPLKRKVEPEIRWPFTGVERGIGGSCQRRRGYVHARAQSRQRGQIRQIAVGHVFA